MNILHINTNIRGGAAKATIRLHQGLISKNIDSELLVLTDTQSIPKVIQYNKTEQTIPLKPPLSLKSWFHEKTFHTYSKQWKQYQETLACQKKQNQFLNQRDKGLELFSFPNSNYDLIKAPPYNNADIVNLHWVSYFLDYTSFFKRNKKPVVWTLHDMNPFTGGEHYVEKYYGINSEGKPIDRIYTKEEIKIQQEIITTKKKVFLEVDNLHIVTPSNWLTQESKKSNILNAVSYQTIPNGIDTSIFSLLPKEAARKVLGLPTDKLIILFVAQSIDKQRKGFIYLQRALENIKDSNILLCAVGHLQQPLKHPNIIELGTIQDERLMSIIYNAADVFVIPSLMDNLPNTVLESLCCGTPVIGFQVGGILDMVQDGINGFLCDEISVDALEATIKKFTTKINTFNNKEISETAKKKYALVTQANAYIKLYESILKN